MRANYIVVKKADGQAEQVVSANKYYHVNEEIADRLNSLGHAATYYTATWAQGEERGLVY